MSEADNPLDEPTSVVLTRLIDLNGYLHLLDIYLGQTKKNLKEMIEAWPGEPVAASLLVFFDLSDESTPWLRAGEPFQRKGNELLGVPSELLRQASLSAASQAYEAFETFLCDAAVAYLHLTHGEPPFDTRDFRLTPPLIKDDLAYWQEYVRYAKRGGNKELLALLGRRCEFIRRIEQDNAKSINLRDWFAAATAVRHAITHQQGIVTERRDISSVAKLKKWFPHETTPQGDLSLQLDPRMARKNLEMFGSYVFLIFKGLSVASGLDYQATLDHLTIRPQV